MMFHLAGDVNLRTEAIIKMSPTILREIPLLVVIAAKTSVSLSYFIELNSH